MTEGRLSDMEGKKQSVFREKTLERINSPEQLTDYLHVTNPGIWVILIAIIVLMAGVFVWSCVGTLETTTPANAVISDHTAMVVVGDGSKLEAGMPLRIASQQYMIASVSEDDYGRETGVAEVDLPDGKYDAIVVTDETKPVEFLLKAVE